MKNETVIKTQLEAYQPNYLEFGPTPQGTRENNYETKNVRFHKLIEKFNLKEEDTLHDIGSGIGGLHKYLKDISIPHTYIGTDIVPEMIEDSKKLHPEANFFVRDILSEEIPSYDYTVLSGTFNMPGNISPKEWEDFVYKIIDRMFETSNKAISFNVLTSFSTFRDPELFYFNPGDVLNHCLENLSRFVSIEHNYILYEATITVFKKDFIASQYKEPLFQKYLQ